MDLARRSASITMTLILIISLLGLTRSAALAEPEVAAEWGPACRWVNVTVQDDEGEPFLTQFRAWYDGRPTSEQPDFRADGISSERPTSFLHPVDEPSWISSVRVHVNLGFGQPVQLSFSCVDTDGDAVPDHQDNCPETSNPAQEDADEDGVGDACEDGGSTTDGSDSDPDGSDPDGSDPDSGGDTDGGDAGDDPDGGSTDSDTDGSDSDTDGSDSDPDGSDSDGDDDTTDTGEGDDADGGTTDTDDGTTGSDTTGSGDTTDGDIVDGDTTGDEGDEEDTTDGGDTNDGGDTTDGGGTTDAGSADDDASEREAGADRSSPPHDDRITRLAGETRIETAVAISQDDFPRPGSAGAVVLARGDDPHGFADALAGTPLAHRLGAPMLITYPDSLHPAVAAEIQRVLHPDGTVYMLGGDVALSSGIAADLQQLGYQVDRIHGATRVETAVEIAEELGDPQTLFVATGSTFPDALSAAAAAAHVDGAVLLTPSEQRAAATDAYLRARPDATVYAIGGPAARPYPEATPVFGLDRERTAVDVARRFFSRPTAAGLAVSTRFPDSLTGSVHLARRGGPMLLSATDQLAGSTSSYLCDNADSIWNLYVYGGHRVVSPTVEEIAFERGQAIGCG